MGKNTSSKLGQVLIVVLLLCILVDHTGSALPYLHEQLIVTGRRMMVSAPGGIGTPGSISRPGPKGGDGPMINYKPNGDIFARPSDSGHGGSRIDQVSYP